MRHERSVKRRTTSEEQQAERARARFKRRLLLRGGVVGGLLKEGLLLGSGALYAAMAGGHGWREHGAGEGGEGGRRESSTAETHRGP